MGHFFIFLKITTRHIQKYCILMFLEGQLERTEGAQGHETCARGHQAGVRLAWPRRDTLSGRRDNRGGHFRNRKAAWPGKPLNPAVHRCCALHSFCREETPRA